MDIATTSSSYLFLLKQTEFFVYILLPLKLFYIGVWGIFSNRRNVVLMLMSIELMLLAVNFAFIIYSVYLDDIIGQIFSIFILTIAAAESAIGLAILVVLYNVRGTIAVEYLNIIKG